MAGMKLRLQIQQSEDHGECRKPRWHGQRAITTNDITGSVMKILITDSKGKRISITIGKNGGIRGVDESLETIECEAVIGQNDPENGAQIISEDNNILSHLLGNYQGGITGTEINLEPNLECVKKEVTELDEIERESSMPFKEVLNVTSEGYNVESLEPELDDEFNTVMENMKSEELNMAGNFETVYVNGAMMLENEVIPKLEEIQDEQRSSSPVFEFADYTTGRSKLCRLCATERKDMVHIFEENEAYKNIVEKIENCLSIFVNKGDPLPDQVCRLCLEKLELCYKFRTTVAEAEKQFIMLGERELNEYRNGEKNEEAYPPPSEQPDVIRPAEKSGPSPAPKRLKRPKRPKRKKKNADEDIIFVGEASQVNVEHIELESQQATERSETQILSDGPLDNTENTGGQNIALEIDNNQILSEEADGQDMIKCRICGMYFGTGKSCYLHSEVHYSQKYYPCCMCNMTFKSKKQCHEHSFQHTARKSVQRRAAMYKDILKNIAVNIEQRDDVQETVNIQDSTEKNEDQDMIKCRICGSFFGTGRSCFAHSQIHYSYKNYPCSMCEKTFTTRAESFKHSAEHTAHKYVQRKAALYREHRSADTDCPEETADNETPSQQMEQRYDIIKCQICGTYFGTPKSCFLHSEIHYSDDRYPCCMCDKIFTTKIDIRRHSIEHTERKPHLKKAETFTKHYSGYHLRSTRTAGDSRSSDGTEKVAEGEEVQEATDNQSDQIKNQDMVKCRICGTYFGSARGCYVHSKIHATENDLPCGMCDKTFTNEKESCEHSEEHIVQKTYEKTVTLYKKKLTINRLQGIEKDGNVLDVEETSSNQNEDKNLINCRICGAKFNNAESCHLHSSVHVENDHYPCTMCDKIFTSEEGASEHSLEHIMGTTSEKGALLHICYLCGEKFSDKSILEIHKINHSRTNKACSCEKCGKLLTSESSLRAHMLNVHKEHKQYSCMICGKKYRSDSQLKGHQAKHADLAYKCSSCGKRFVHNENLKLHKLKHCRSLTEGKHFSCSYCGLMFLRSWFLAKHMKKHTGERATKGNFNCNVCGKSFLYPNGLKEHLHTHSEHKPYGCLMCDKTFKSLKLRKDHMRAVHLDDKRYKCDICERKFMRPSALRIHKRARHEMK